MKDSDFEWKYRPVKANKVVYALSTKEVHTIELMMLEHNLMEKLRYLNLHFTWTQEGVLISQMNIICNLC